MVSPAGSKPGFRRLAALALPGQRIDRQQPGQRLSARQQPGQRLSVRQQSGLADPGQPGQRRLADQQRQGQRRLRRDIQALRALAVMMVLVYHLWGNFLGGAFVGVDIFFVISGFLITQHLISHPPTNCFDLVVFWGKRIRRLLPAAFTVIAVTLLFAWLFMPSTLRGNTASSAFGATLYFANWQLSAAAVDYLAATASPTPFQHFWSLAVEEQFYLIWPVIVGVAAGLGRRFGKPNILGLLMALVTAGSLAYCIHKTATDSAAAYFVTPGRVWELASGGLLAVGYPQIHRYMQSRWWLRRLAGGSGLVVMLASCWLIRSDANFPGVVAIWPVLGALLVIAAGPQSERFAKYSPIQFLGNASYSIYLWHYPVVVLLPHIIGHSLNTFTKLIAAVGIIGLAGLSKKYIEDRWRGNQPLGKPLRRTFIFLLAGSLPLAGCSLFLANLAHADQLVPISTNRAADRCLGAGRLLNQTCQNNDLRGTTLILSPQQAAQDKSSAYADQCWWLKRLPNQFPTCQYGSTDKQAKRVALIGNSHAGPWLSPLQDFAKTDNFSITTYLASECFPSTLGLVFEGYANASASCLEYTRRTIQAIKQNNTDLVIISAFLGDRQLVGVSADKRESAVMTMWQTMLTDLADSGISVLVIRDLPSNLNETPDCVAAHRNDLSLCDWPRPGEGQVDWLYQAALQLHRPTVSTLDLTDGLCDNTTCYSVLGGVITFFNQGHLSSTFARTLTPWLRTAVNRALAATG